MRSLRWVLPAALVTLVSCAKEVPVVEVAGECSDVYGAKLCTWAQMKGDSVLAIGAEIPIAFLENAPEHTDMVWPPALAADLALPEAARAQSGIAHLTVLWESMGHPPGPFLTPHFDFHFYTMTQAERRAIDCSDLSKPAALAEGYVLPDFALPPPMVPLVGQDSLIGLCVPTMGMHSLLASQHDSPVPLEGTMVLGYYKTGLIFVEPMVSKAVLMQKKPFELPIPAVPGAGKYPRSFRADFDSTKQSYRFVFTGFGS